MLSAMRWRVSPPVDFFSEPKPSNTTKAMTKKRKSTISTQKTGDGFIGRVFAQTKLPAHVTEEQDWYLDTPDVRLTRVFTVVLILHVVAVGGILAFKMVEKASTPAIVASADTATSQEIAPSAESANPAEPKVNAAPAPAPAESQTPATAAKDSGTALTVNHPSAADYQEYCVAAGDTLASIAQKLNVSAAQIREINNLDGGENLYPGRWIRAPKTSATPSSAVAAIEPKAPEVAPKVEKPAVPAAPAPVVAEKKPVQPTAPAATAAAKPDSYQVQKGETLFSIARRFGVKYQDLMAANGIDKAESLQAGQTLRVPQD